VLWLTSGLFTRYAEALTDVFLRLRYLLVGGDVVDPATIIQTKRHNSHCHLLNGYGPTECTTFSATYLIESIDEHASSVPIGRPISNTQIYILDNQHKPVPIGVAGEIYIGGAGVGCGYLNRPELTAAHFVADPFSANPRARMYRSGDLGRWQVDGNIEYLGRNDHQVKIRGFRIELGEVESQLTRHAQVKESVVIAQEYVPGEKRLVAYVIPKDPFGAEMALDANGLRAHLKSVLPEYMVPSVFVILEHRNSEATQVCSMRPHEGRLRRSWLEYGPRSSTSSKSVVTTTSLNSAGTRCSRSRRL
jgi:acyl-coenzyme A synthetase/AMP-(fatty) acid ligase